MEQIQARRFFDSARSKVLERASFSDRISTFALRDELLTAASVERQSWKTRRLLYAGLQSGLDLPGRVYVDRGPLRRKQDRPAHRVDSNLERDGVFRRLCFANGQRER